MLAYKSTNIIFGGLLLGLIALNFYQPINGILYAILLFVYIIVIASGSSFISYNFFLKAYNNGNTQSKEIALTFDDGPLPDITPKVLDVLKKFDAKATFFLIGNRISGNESIVQRILDEGHLIGNHTFNHDKKFGFFSKEKVKEEILETNAIIEDRVQKKLRFFRPPFGTTNPTVKAAIEELGCDVIGWNIRSFDTLIKNPETVLKRIKKQVAPGAIVLLHDIYPKTVPLVEQLLEHLQQIDYKVVPLDKLIERNAYE